MEEPIAPHKCDGLGRLGTDFRYAFASGLSRPCIMVRLGEFWGVLGSFGGVSNGLMQWLVPQSVEVVQTHGQRFRYCIIILVI